ncbi:hypothetical protein ACO1NF_14075, partial [Staphylococcus aureus]
KTFFAGRLVRRYLYPVDFSAFAFDNRETVEADRTGRKHGRQLGPCKWWRLSDQIQGESIQVVLLAADENMDAVGVIADPTYK